MSCACEHKKMSEEYERIRRLAKSYAKIEDVTVAIYRKDDGSYNFTVTSETGNKEIIEYITKY